MTRDPRIPRARRNRASRTKSKDAIIAADLDEIKDTFSTLRGLGVTIYSAKNPQRRRKLMIRMGYGYKDGYWIKGLKYKDVDSKDAAIIQTCKQRIIYDTEMDFKAFDLKCAKDPQKRELLMTTFGYIKHDGRWILEAKNSLTKFLE